MVNPVSRNPRLIHSISTKSAPTVSAFPLLLERAELLLGYFYAFVCVRPFLVVLGIAGIFPCLAKRLLDGCPLELLQRNGFLHQHGAAISHHLGKTAGDEDATVAGVPDWAVAAAAEPFNCAGSVRFAIARSS